MWPPTSALVFCVHFNPACQFEETLFICMCRRFWQHPFGCAAVMSLLCSPFPHRAIYESAGGGVGGGWACLWFNTHTPTGRGLWECMCWWKSNVLCLQGTFCFSLTLLQLHILVFPQQPGTFSAKESSPKCFLSSLSLSSAFFHFFPANFWGKSLFKISLWIQYLCYKKHLVWVSAVLEPQHTKKE